MPTIVYCYHLPSEDQPHPPLAWEAFETSGEPRRVGIVPKILDTVDEHEIFRSVAPFLNEVIAVEAIDPELSADELATIITNGSIFPRTFIGDNYRPRDNQTSYISTCRTQDLEFQVDYDKVVTPYDVARTRRKFGRKCVDLVRVHAVNERIEQRRRDREQMPSERGRSLPFMEPATKTPSIITVTKTFYDYMANKHALHEAYTGPLPQMDVVTDPYAAARPAPQPVPPPPPPPPERPPVARIPAHAEEPARRWRADIDG